MCKRKPGCYQAIGTGKRATRRETQGKGANRKGHRPGEMYRCDDVGGGGGGGVVEVGGEGEESETHKQRPTRVPGGQEKSIRQREREKKPRRATRGREGKFEPFTNECEEGRKGRDKEGERNGQGK